MTSTESAICPCGLNTAYCFKHRPPATFVVTELLHPDCKFCLDHAVHAESIARVSGSTGGTSATTRPDGVAEHSATVRRAGSLPNGLIVLHPDEPVSKPPDPNVCPNCFESDTIVENQEVTAEQKVRFDGVGELEYGDTKCYYEACSVTGYSCRNCLADVEPGDNRWVMAPTGRGR